METTRRFDEVHHELARRLRVGRADAHRTKENTVVRTLGDELPNAAPQQKKTGGASLVTLAHERSSHLERRAHPPKELGVDFEERIRIKRAGAATEELVGGTEPIRSDKGALAAVEYEQVHIRCVESIEIARRPRPFLHQTKCDLAQASDF